ncbi:hypothetical protein NOC27_1475 [Nitrosococcus oceani AFC27]|nr:hypothetical protein NOC27_1475 [Nitrosococcus oceani AFC27]
MSQKKLSRAQTSAILAWCPGAEASRIEQPVQDKTKGVRLYNI